MKVYRLQESTARIDESSQISSQSTIQWPIKRQTWMGEVVLRCHAENCQVSRMQLRPVDRVARRDLLEEVFLENAEAWRRLAEL